MKEQDTEEVEDKTGFDYDLLLKEVQAYIANNFDEDEEDYYAKISYPNTPSMTCVSIVKFGSDTEFPCKADLIFKKNQYTSKLVCAMRQPGDMGYDQTESVPFVDSQLTPEGIYRLVENVWEDYVVTDWM